MIIYIAAPYRAKNNKTTEENIANARAVAVEVWRKGHRALCPHTNSALFENDLGDDYTDELRLSGTLDLLRRCDAILMVGDWEESEGAIAEHEYATSVGMPIFYYQQFGIPPLHLTEINYPRQCRFFIDTVMRMYRVHLNKNRDYSPANILGTGEIGLITRIWDKTVRIMSLSGFRIEDIRVEQSGTKLPNYESLADSFLDLAVYSIIAILYKMGVWGK